MSRVTLRWFGDGIKRWARSKGAKRLELAGKAGVEYARAIVPVDTGQLKDSIGYTFNQSAMTVTLYADKDYAVFIEFGTQYVDARPFIRPALIHMGSILSRGESSRGTFPGTDPYYGGPEAFEI